MQKYKIFGFLEQHKIFHLSGIRISYAMNIAYYMPFKPMDHPNPSGDLITGTEIFTTLGEAGHTPREVSKLRLRWVYYKPAILLRLFRERKRLTKSLKNFKPELWFSYHCYYKAPDLLGSYCSKKLGIPYVIFQGIYSTKRRKKPVTYPGFILNRNVLKSADHIFTNKKRDHVNLKRIIPSHKLTFIPPGINPEDFTFSEIERKRQRRNWQTENATVIMTAAMMRPGVKTEGLFRVIKACHTLITRGICLQLIIAGDGQCDKMVRDYAQNLLGKNSIFLGKVPREQLHRFYSGADIFAFPGIQESLGLVYLEAQSCGLPVVAFEDWGGGEAVIHGASGLLSPADKPELFTENIARLIQSPPLRHQMGKYAQRHIRQNHDLKKNYRLLADKLQAIATSKNLKN